MAEDFGGYLIFVFLLFADGARPVSCLSMDPGTEAINSGSS